jgi:hydrogenase maturation protein HypF
VHDDFAGARLGSEIAAAFHEAIAAGAAGAVEDAGERGTFQNLRLLASTRSHLEERGFRVLAPRPVPPNDSGIGYVQAAVAART